jgi:hypothetical protein
MSSHLLGARRLSFAAVAKAAMTNVVRLNFVCSIIPNIIAGFLDLVYQLTVLDKMYILEYEVARLVEAQLGSLEFFIHVILPASLWPWDRLSL